MARSRLHEVVDGEMVDEQTAPDIAVDRGQPVIATVTFDDGDPDEISFIYMRPKDERPYADDGFGQPRSRIERLSEGTYRYTIDTTGFESGDGTWKCCAEWSVATRARPYVRAAIKGRYHVNSAPSQLL